MLGLGNVFNSPQGSRGLSDITGWVGARIRETLGFVYFNAIGCRGLYLRNARCDPPQLIKLQQDNKRLEKKGRDKNRCGVLCQQMAELFFRT